ncbi:MAG: KamA family radical SAM protein [Planctomycetaceae bacterium]|jgi:lysine 2,3-aminomutase|nr:KamA family radical SAM protein [Planctomycetaceae bacterium]
MLNTFQSMVDAGFCRTSDPCPDSAVKLSDHLLSLIDRNDPADPIAKQFVPDPRELKIIKSEEWDSLGEEEKGAGNVLFQKYPNRCVLYVSTHCAAFCRFCTRKRRVEDEAKDVGNDYEAAFQYLREHPEIEDVLVTGGDPLMLAPSKLEYYLKNVKSIPSVKCIRIGTRVLISNPKQLTDEHCRVIAENGVKFVNCQFNHPREISPQTIEAIDRFKRFGISLNNQCVLLKGVNDSVETMRTLCMRLYEVGVRPYYIYQCDLIPGLSHFRTTITKGRFIHSRLRGFISGVAIPFYIVDIPAGMGKVHCTRDNFVEFDPEITNQGPGVAFDTSINPTLEYPVRKFFNYQNKSFLYDERELCPNDIEDTARMLSEAKKEC